MLNISEETKTGFLDFGTNKELKIEMMGLDGKTLKDFNMCTSYLWFHEGEGDYHIEPGEYKPFYVAQWDRSLDTHQLLDYYGYHDQVVVSAEFHFQDIVNLPNKINFVVFVKYEDDYQKEWSITVDTPTVNQRYYIILDNNYEGHGNIKKINDVGVRGLSSWTSDLIATMWYGSVVITVKDSDDPVKGYIEHSEPNTNLVDYIDYTLTNDNIVGQSFNMTEALCSADNIKFGLCESSYMNVSVGDLPNADFKNKVAKAFIRKTNLSKQQKNKINFYSGSYNPSGFSLTWNNSTASGAKNTGNSFNADFESAVNKGIIAFNSERYVCVRFKAKLDTFSITGSSIEPKYIKFSIRNARFPLKTATSWVSDGGRDENTYISIDDLQSGFVTFKMYFYMNLSEYKKSLAETYGENLLGFGGLLWQLVDENFNYLSSGTVTAKITFNDAQICFVDSIFAEPSDFNATDARVYNNSLDSYYSDELSYIPLGVFNITSVKRNQKGMYVEKQLTAYDNLVRLEENAADWYTTYMFGICFDDYSAFRGIQWPRQIYSTYFNYAKNIGIEKREYYTETVIGEYEYFEDIKPNYMTNKYITWESTAPRKFVKYCCIPVSNVDSSKRYVVDFTNVDGETDEELLNDMPPDFLLHWDELGRGVGSQASILIEDSEGNRFLCNKGDYFMISPGATSFDVYISTTCVESDNTGIRLLDNVTISKVENAIDLANGYIPLVYYEYPTGLIFPCESNITGRDVIRSLIEVCGAFYKLDRNGIPQFKYCTKSALYPSNELYPADNLYPRGGGDGKLPLGMYTDFVCEDYSVKDYGKIQILKETRSSETKSVVEWEYVGDSTKKNTYIIDDNIFYCAEEMQYDYDLMPEIGEMLENMYIRISNLGFTPCDVQAIGMPWLECGDRITLLTVDSGFESFVFSRYLSGIQLMLDNLEAKGDEQNPEIDNYGYKLIGE